jgi:hypothetical protein
MKELIKKMIKEQTESNKEKFIRYVASKLKPPYFKNINDLGVEKNEIEPILSLIFNQPVRIKQKTIYDELDNEIYDEDSDGSWEKKEYDERGNLISKYYKYSDGSWEKLKYGERGKLIYREKSDGYWVKYEYDENNYLSYRENSSGNWEKYGYNRRGKLIYQENSINGITLDKR